MTVGFLQSSRGRSMERATFQRGPKSSSVKAASLLSWTVKPQPHLETPARLTRLLNSPAQVKVKLYVWFGLSFHNDSNINSLCLFSCICAESDDVRLVGGTSNCTGILEMHHQREWRPADGGSDWNQNSSAVVCRQLDCGSAVSTERSSGSKHQPSWRMTTSCLGSESSLEDCATKMSATSSYVLEVICSGNKLPRLQSFIHCFTKLQENN